MPGNRENEKQEKVEHLNLKSRLKTFIWEVFLFCLTFFIGLVSAVRLGKTLELQEIVLPEISFWNFILAFSIATLFILFVSFSPIIKKGKGAIYRTLFVVTIWWTGASLISVWLFDIAALSLMGLLILWRWKKPNVFNHNLCMVLGLAGVGAILGMNINPKTMILLLLLFSVYDFIAVYKTKHMQKMAKEMARHRAVLAFIIPKEIVDFKKSLEETKPGGEFLMLGGGDIVFPLVFCVSLLSSGVANALIVAVFSLIGLSVSFLIFISQKLRKPMPALPPIAFFSIIGYFLTLLFN